MKFIAIAAVVLLVLPASGIAVDKNLGIAETTRLTIEGRNLSDEEAKMLEETVRQAPNDLSSRTKLLGYYFTKSLSSATAQESRQKHIFWIIKNHPESGIAGLPYAQIHSILNVPAYAEAKKLWLKQVDAHKKDTAILGNAANFVLLEDRALAENLLQQAEALDPNNPEWPKRLGHLYSLPNITPRSPEAKQEAAAKSLSEFKKALSATKEESSRFYLLTYLAKSAFYAGKWNEAKDYASKLLDQANQDKDGWNYGNAIHHGNIILGRLALRAGDVSKAKEYLLLAGKTPGSPQLDSFGPNMALARELLEKGEKEAVIEYFQLCGEFWKQSGGQLEKWTAAVKKGEIPDFGGNENY